MHLSTPKNNIAPVVRLFASRPAKHEHFEAIRHIESVSIGREARLKLLVNGSLPTEFLESLTCHIECPLVGIASKSALRFISREGDTVTMGTAMLRPQWDETLSPGPQAIIRIESPKGEMLQDRLVPLLLAAMK